LPIDQHDREEIAAAIGAYNATGRRPLLLADVIRLLTVMFAEADICQRNQDSLAAEGFSRGALVRLLQALVETGLVSKERGANRRAPNTYRLHLPPRSQP
jgi:hypothetical protein